MLMKADDYLDSIRRRGIRVYYRGEALENPVDHPVAGPAANCLAEVYRLALDPEHGPLLTAPSEHVDGRVNASTILWRSPQDLVDRVEWERLVARRTGRGALRSPGLDALNALAIVTRRLDREEGTAYRRRLDAFQRELHESDWAVSGAMTDPRGDRSKRPSEQADPDLYLRVVERRKDGVVLRGAKMHQTSACHAHWHLVLPLACRPGEEDWAVAAAVPSDAPGLWHVYGRQMGDDRRFEEGDVDVGVKAFGGCETLLVFDDVFVPTERVFLNGETRATPDLVRYFGSFHRHCYGGCKVGIGDVAIGAAAALAEVMGIDGKSGVRDKLTEMLHLNETLYACAMGAAARAEQAEDVTIPSLALANVTKLNVTRFPFEIARLAADLAGGAMATLPSEQDLRHPEIGPVVRKYLSAREGSDPEERIRLLRLLEFLTHGMGSSYFLHESLHGAGAPEAMKITLRREIDLAPLVANARALAGCSS